LATVRDVSDNRGGVAIRRSSAEPNTYRSRLETVHDFTPEDLGYGEQAPARTWAYTIDGSLTAEDGQTLGYTWTGVIDNWRMTAFVSFGDGHGVWEKGSGPLPFSGRNHTSARQWVKPLAPDQLMPTIRELKERDFRLAPEGPGFPRALRATPDQTLAHGLDLGPALNTSGTGLAWVAIQPGATIPRSRPRSASDRPIATIVQTTNLGITVKDSPQNTLVFVTRLDMGDPVPAADVSIVRLDNSVAWSGRTNADGTPSHPLCSSAIPGVPGSCASSSPPRKTATWRTSGATGTRGSNRSCSGTGTTSARRSRCYAERSLVTGVCTSWARRSMSKRSSAATRRAAFS
jgi:hypothetical protein